ncbi:hypothetical protein [Pseudoalteromonas sp. MMG007]|uniref:hypothetical protein n=1 Tax=Pseudoalteromonas sp. MMG007 TaxID=2822684 RepID=UPI001B38A226|nr:hypothetical protein [Pseudoalteromonas sp. MMG007]MBQ4859244.1 hypothetical protein [Pseudoalteromonas sp. MMG007]
MSVELSSAVYVSDIATFKAENDKDSIIEFLKQRYEERFIAPFENNSLKHGFSMMAVSCLMVESLISMQKGVNETSDMRDDENKKIYPSKLFEEFFTNSNHLNSFTGLGYEFYKNIRCGILHQAESTNGWRVRRDGKLVNKTDKVINATKFLKALKMELSDYLDLLNNSDFTEQIWVNLFKKIEFIIDNSISE